MFFPEHEYTVSNKSEDELKKFTLEENLSEVQRAYIILTKGQHLQKRAVYMNLHRLLKDQKQFDTLFPVIIEEVQQQDEENQIIAAKSLVRLLRETHLTQNIQLQMFHLIQHILKIWSLPVVNEWILTMEMLLKQIQLDSVLPNISRLILMLTDVSQPTVSRQSSCRLIGILAEQQQLLKDDIKGPLFDRARSLCSDQEQEVRFVMADEVMVRLCLSICTDLIETYMLEKILELYYDSDIQVKSAGMKLFYSIAHKLSQEEQKNRCVKLFIDQMQSKSEESQILMSKICGKVYNLLKDHIEKQEKSQIIFFNIYREFVKHKNQEIRINFAYNFPAILSLSQKKFEFFQDVYKISISDKSEEVMRCAISAFHEVVLLSETNDILVQTLFTFLSQKNYSILEVLLRRLPLIMNAFQQHLQPQFAPACFELLNHLVSNNQWELQAIYLENMLQFQTIFTDIDGFLEAMMKTISKGSHITRRLAALNITKYISKYHDWRKRNQVLQLLMEEYLKSDTYKNRLTYLDLIEGFCQDFSRRLFKQSDLFNVLELAKDHVINVRVKFLKILPILRKMIEPEDDDIIHQFDEAMQQGLGKGAHSFQQVIQITKELLLQVDDEEQIQKRDQELMNQEDFIQLNDQKKRQLELDQEKDEFDFRKTDLNDYLNKYRKKYPQSKTKLISQQIVRKEKQQLSGSLFVKKSVDYDGCPITTTTTKSPDFQNKRPLTKAKTPMMKSVTDVKRQFKLPSIKK